MDVPSIPNNCLSSSLGDLTSSMEFDKKDINFTSAENIIVVMSGGGSDRESYSGSDSESANNEIHKASRKQKILAKKSIKRDKKREKDQRKKIEKNMISMDDFLSKQSEYKVWLQEERGKCVAEMTSSKLKSHFKTFVKLWNKKKLPLKYYRGSVGNETPPATDNSQRFSFIDDHVAKAQALKVSQLTNLAQENNILEDSPFSTFGKIPPKMKCKNWSSVAPSPEGDPVGTDRSPGASPVFAMIHSKENKKRSRIPPKHVSSPQIGEYQVPQVSKKPLKSPVQVCGEYHVPQKVCKLGNSSSSEGEKSPTKRSLNWDWNRTTNDLPTCLVHKADPEKFSDSDSTSLMSMPADGTSVKTTVKPQVHGISFQLYDGDNSSISSMSTDKSRSHDNLKQTTDNFSLSSMSADGNSNSQLNDVDSGSQSSLANDGITDLVLWPSPPSPVPGDNLSYLEYKKRCKNRRSSLPPPPPPIELLHRGTFDKPTVIEEETNCFTFSPNDHTSPIKPHSCSEDKSADLHPYMVCCESKTANPHPPMTCFEDETADIACSKDRTTKLNPPITYSVDSTAHVLVTFEGPPYQEISTLQSIGQTEIGIDKNPSLNSVDVHLKPEEPMYAQVVKNNVIVTDDKIPPSSKHMPPSSINFKAVSIPEIPPKLYLLEEDNPLAGNVSHLENHTASHDGEETSNFPEDNDARILRAKSKEYFEVVQSQTFKSPPKQTPVNQVTAAREITQSINSNSNSVTIRGINPVQLLSPTENLEKRSVTFKTDSRETTDKNMKRLVEGMSQKVDGSLTGSQNGIMKPSQRKGVRKISRTKLNSLCQLNKKAGVLETDIDAIADNDIKSKTKTVETDIW